MAVLYPSAIDALPTNLVNSTLQTNVHPSYHNDIHGILTAIENELGLLPKGSFASVRARLDAIQNLTNAFTATGHTTDRSITKKVWTTSNVITDRNFDANAFTQEELGDLVGTLIQDYNELENFVMTLAAELKGRVIG